jgi:uncharacterized membrane protein
MDYAQFLTTFGNDLAAFAASVFLLLVYHRFLAYKVKRNPAYSVQSVNVIARTAWVHSIMDEGKKDVLPVQTFRNSTMASVFLASTSVLLIMGVMSLSGQADKLDSSWHALNVLGAKHAALWQIKLLLILIDLFFAFFSFSMSIRIFNHVGYMINVPPSMNQRMISPAHVAGHLNRAGYFFSIGMRSYHFLMPLVFWLFGPHFMLAGTLGLILVLYYVDRAPKLAEMDYGEELRDD